MNDWLAQTIHTLLSGETIEASAWPENAQVAPADLDLIERDGGLQWRAPPDQLHQAAISAALPGLSIEVLQVVDSTNTRLMEAAATGSIADRLLLAELQTGGRGRRGRSWLSPYARNLSMSLGAGLSRPLAELGGLSLVVGLGLAAGLERLGVVRPMLKWPNDVLVGGVKICGILIELVSHGGGSEAVIGMGVNVQLHDPELAAIGQPATDLRRCGVIAPRDQVVIEVLQAVRRNLQLFEERGFAAFIDAFNAVHQFHGRSCVISTGTQRMVGSVAGVGMQGELLLDTATGRQTVHGGEVSLRPATIEDEESSG